MDGDNAVQTAGRSWTARTLDWLAAQGSGGTVRCADAVTLRDLPPLTRLVVLTANSLYEIVVLEGTKIRIRGGERFPEPCAARLDGAVGDGSALKVGWIGVGYRMEIRSGTDRIVTSRVRAITLYGSADDARPSGTAA